MEYMPSSIWYIKNKISGSVGKGSYCQILWLEFHPQSHIIDRGIDFPLVGLQPPQVHPTNGISSGCHPCPNAQDHKRLLGYTLHCVTDSKLTGIRGICFAKCSSIFYFFFSLRNLKGIKKITSTSKMAIELIINPC